MYTFLESGSSPNRNAVEICDDLSSNFRFAAIANSSFILAGFATGLNVAE